MMIGDLVTGRSADSTGSGGSGVTVPLEEMDDPGKVQNANVGTVGMYIHMYVCMYVRMYVAV